MFHISHEPTLNPKIAKELFFATAENENCNFNSKLEIEEYKNITTSKDKIISRWKNSMTNGRPENVEIKTIQTKYDGFNN